MSIELSCEISYSGELLVIAAQVAGTAPSGGFDQLQAVTSVTGTPTLYKNGTPVTLYGPIWNDGSNNPTFGQSCAIVAYYLTGGAVAPSDAMTITIPANFVNGSSPAYTNASVYNYTGQIEGPFGHMPGLTGTPTTGAGLNIGQPSIDYSTCNYLPANQLFRGEAWRGTGLATDSLGYPVSWPATSTLHRRCYGPTGTNSLDGRGWPNEMGVWSLIWTDSAIGTTGLTTTVTPVADGSGIVITPGTPTVSGNVTILPFTVGYTSSKPSSWYMGLGVNVSAPANNTGGSDGLAHWALGNGPFLVPPNSADGTQVSSTFLNSLPTNPYRLNPNVKLQLTGGGNAASHLRGMESALGTGGENNYIYTIDMPSAACAAWQAYPTARSMDVVFDFVRFLNTNPAKGSGGDGTYNWTPSTKVYGPQGHFVLSDGVTTPITATLTSGSLNITITTSPFPAIMAGSIVTGTGIPANTRLAYFNASTGSGTLTNPATASGPQSLTVANPKYAPLRASDNGGFMVNGFGQGAWVAIELRSTLPHGLTSHQTPDGTSNTNGNSIQVTNFGTYNPGLGGLPLYVTGPYTIAIFAYTGTSGSTVQGINNTSEYNFTSSGGWSIVVNVPFETSGTMPPEVMMAMCVDLGAPRCWLNLPGFGVDELYTQIGQRVAAQASTTIDVLLERVDEPWNYGTVFAPFMFGNLALQNLLDSYPNGTVVSAYLTTNSSVPVTTFGYNGLAGNVLATGRTRDLFAAAWTAAGRSAGHVKTILGCQWGNQSPVQNTLGAAQQWQVPADYVVIAPYMTVPGCTPIVNAMNASGGNMSLPAINDYVRLSYIWDAAFQGEYLLHQQFLQAWGQPTVPLNVQGYTLGGGIPAGGYNISSTWLDASGNETTPGTSPTGPFGVGGFPDSNHYYINMTMPVTPGWVHSVNFYGAGSTTPVSQQFFVVNVPTLAGGGTIAPGATVQLSSIPGSGNHPPTTNGVPSSSAGTAPQLGSYEGGDAITIPPSVTGYETLTHDVHAHPSRWLSIYTWYMSTQIGCQWSPGSGMALATWFAGWAGPGFALSVLNPPDYDDWIIYNGAGQPAGQGLSNQYATTRTGATGPGDGQDHNGGAPLATGFGGVQVRNVCPGGYGLQQWIAAGSPIAPTVTSTTPTSGATSVSVNTTVAVVFSVSMQSSMLTLTLNGTSIPLTSYNNATFTAVFTPSSSLANGTSYSAAINGASSSGTAMSAAYAWSFTTVDAAPTVTATTPVNGAIAVALNSTLTATFSEAVGSGSIAFTLTPLGGSAVTGTTSYKSGTHVATFTPTANLVNNTLYTATVTANAPDGTPMGGPYSWTFTSVEAVPTVVSTVPASGATLVSPTAAITVAFSEPIFASGLSLTLSPSAALSSPTYNPSTYTASWTPLGTSLAYATAYTATVGSVTLDLAETSSPRSWSFATHEAPPTGQGVIVPIGWQFSGAVDASSMSMTLTKSSDGSSVSGTASYDGTYYLVSFTPTSPLTAGIKYLATLSGVKTTGGTAIPSVSWPITPGTQKSSGWLGGVGGAAQA
jgi:hypothetical protein